MSSLKNIKWTNEKKYRTIHTIKSIVWKISLALYFIIGFAFNGWKYSWIIFIIAIAINKIVKLSIEMRE